jgi:hypothetical protein
VAPEPPPLEAEELREGLEMGERRRRLI